MGDGRSKYIATPCLLVLALASCGSRAGPRVTGTISSTPTPVAAGDYVSEPDDALGAPSLSADARFVAYSGVGGVQVLDRKTGKTEVVSVSTKGDHIGSSDGLDISANGRFITFFSTPDRVFVRDRVNRTTTLASVSSSGKEANAGPLTPRLSMSDDGRFVAFNSLADNLVPNDTNRVEDIFVRDTTSKQTVRVSISSSGEQANGVSAQPRISNNGRFIVFIAQASNLVPEAIPRCSIEGTRQICSELYVHDRLAKVTSLVSVSTAGKPATGRIQDPSISDDGRYIAFSSDSPDLRPGEADTDGKNDIFLHDRQTRETVQVSTPGAGSKTRPEISGTGALIAYGGESFDLRLHDIATGADRSLGSHRGDSVDFSVDDRFIVFANGDDEVVLFDLADGTSETIP